MLKFLFSTALLLGFTVSPVLATNPSVSQLQDQLIEAQYAGDEERQEKLLNQLLKQDPNNEDAYQFLGLLLEQQMRDEEAIALYQTAIQRRPKNTFFYDRLASLFTRTGQLPKAIKLLQNGIETNPDAALLYSSLGMLLRDANRTDEAIALFRRGLKLNAPDVVFFYQSLGDLLSEKNPNEAIALLQQGLKRQPEEVAFHSLMPPLANLLTRQNRLDEAIALYREGIRRRPNEPTAYYSFAFLLTANNRANEAIALYREAIRRNPKESSFYVMLGEIYQQQNQSDNAIALYQKGIRQAEHTSNIYSVWGDLLVRRGRTEDAIKLYREAIRRNPGTPALYSELARILEANQRIDEAVAVYQQSIEREELDRNLQLIELSDLLIRQKQGDRMIALYQAEMQKRPDNLDLLRQVGGFLMLQSRAKDAEPIYRRVIQLHPKALRFDEMEDYHRLAAILSQQGRGAEAIAIAEKTIQLSKQNRGALFFSYVVLGWLQVQEKQFTQATQSLQKAVAINDRSPATCLLGGVLTLQNQPEQAIATYRKLLSEVDGTSFPSSPCMIMGVALLQPDQLEARIAALRQDQPVYFGFQDRSIDAKAIAHNGIGEVLQHQGKIREAIAEYEKAIQIDSEFAVAKENLQRARALMR